MSWENALRAVLDSVCSPASPAALPWLVAARNSQAPEHRIAEQRGYVLEATLGKGHYGRVYRGRSKATGQVNPRHLHCIGVQWVQR
jgi:hypothetical protein